MATLIPFSIQKRLLRYALSQLELIDTESLNLDQLNIAWGSRSTVELRDVRLHIAKLSALFCLPDNVRIIRGRIRNARITVPADLFRSGIVLEVTGIEIHLDTRQETRQDETTGVHHAAEKLPTSKDVARSFLREEPLEEKQELEAAFMSASTQDLERSILSEASEDEEAGTGVPITLPGFLAGFLKGVADRLEVIIKDVETQIEFDILSDEAAGQDDLHGSMSFCIPGVSLEGLTPVAPETPHVSEARSNRRNKRHVHLKSVEARLTLPRWFSELQTRLSGLSSPAVSHQNSSREWQPGRNSESSPSQSQTSDSTPNMQYRARFDEHDSQYSSEPSPPHASQASVPADTSSRSTSAIPDVEDDRFADASDDEEEPQSLQSSAHEGLLLSGIDTSLSEPRSPSFFMQQSSLGDYPFTEHFASEDHRYERDSESSGESDSPEANDLSESKLFTHEEAASMYLSAMSEIPAGPTQIAESSSFAKGRSASDQTEECHNSTELALDHQGFVHAAWLTEETSQGEEISLHSGTSTQSPTSSRSAHTDSSRSPRSITVPVMSVDGVSIWIPWTGNAAPPEITQSDTESESSTSYDPDSRIEMPGAFSSKQRRTKSSKPIRKTSEKAGMAPLPHKLSDSTPSLEDDYKVIVDIGDINCQCSISVGVLALQTLQNVFSGTAPAQGRQANKQVESPEEESFNTSVCISLTRIHASLCQQMSRTLGNTRSSHDFERLALTLDMDLAGARATYRRNVSSAEAKLEIFKFSVGVSGRKLLHFDEQAGLTATVAQLPQMHKHNISMVYNTNLDRGRELHIRTLPLFVNFNMAELEDDFSCFGGLSGILDLSSSIASASTILGAPLNSRNPQNGKSVRFDSDQGHEKSLASKLKMNCRVEGLQLVLTGQSCGISLQTSALKLVGRDFGASAAISAINLKGPILKSSPGSPSIDINLLNTAVDFLYTPQQNDLEQLISLITPSRDKFGDDDGLIITNLLTQRRTGSLIRMNFSRVEVRVPNMETVNQCRSLTEEFSKLSKVAKYLPDDERPGVLTMVKTDTIDLQIRTGLPIGDLFAKCVKARIAFVALPELFAVELGSIYLDRGRNEKLIHPLFDFRDADQLPAVMARKIGDQLDPKFKIKLYNIAVEYWVSVIMDLRAERPLGSTSVTTESTQSSTSTIRGKLPATSSSVRGSPLLQRSSSSPQLVLIDVHARDCAIVLNPDKKRSKGILFFSSTTLQSRIPSDATISGLVELREASLALVDDVAALDPNFKPSTPPKSTDRITDFIREGYCTMGTIQSANATVNSKETECGSRAVDIRAGLGVLVVEACADSTKTLVDLFEGLVPPAPPSTIEKYRTNPVPIQGLINSFLGEEFEVADEPRSRSPDVRRVVREEADQYDMVGSFFEPDKLEDGFEVIDWPEASRSDAPSDISYQFDDDQMSLVETEPEGMMVWASRQGTVSYTSDLSLEACPLHLDLNVQTLIINLHDGYDWAKTQEKISRAVEEVEAKSRRKTYEPIPDLDEEESEIGDFLFQSIWIVPCAKDGNDIRRQINQDLDDGQLSENTVPSMSLASGRTQSHRKTRSLKLSRSSRPKISIELGNLSVEFVAFPPGSGETQSRMKVSAWDLEIFDHVPTSTWRKFATGMHNPGHRHAPMVDLTLFNVKVVPDLAATEFAAQVVVQPIRLHVDQDALEFLMRFSEFELDDCSAPKKPSEEPFIQRLEVAGIQVRMDYKPKKVDYRALRSGRTTELMNFLPLEDADIVLRKAILFGISGFRSLHTTLNDIWMPDIKRRQISTILTGVVGVRPIVNVTNSMRTLVTVPIEEYHKDGKLFKSIKKGAVVFARNTTTDVARLAGKMSIGAQNILEGTETFLSPSSSSTNVPGNSSSGEARSNYADQPLTVLAGLRTGMRKLEEDLLTTKDAIIAIGGDFRESETAAHLVKAVARRAPTVILRPVAGVTKALGSAFMGVGNSLDKDSRRKVQDKYK